MLWMYCIEASPGIYKSTRLGGQDSPGYIWQSTIHISTTTKYTLIVDNTWPLPLDNVGQLLLASALWAHPQQTACALPATERMTKSYPAAPKII